MMILQVLRRRPAHGYALVQQIRRASNDLLQVEEGSLQLFAHPPARWYSSLLVVAEGYGWFLHRLGEDAARTFRKWLAELPHLTLLPIDQRVHDQAGHKLDRLRGHKLTYVDAASLVFLERLRIREVWGTDRDLSLEGARVLPA